jgi:flagellar hook-basal body complex protein FliE
MSAIVPTQPVMIREGGLEAIGKLDALEQADRPEPVGFGDVLGGLLSEAAASKVEATKQAEDLARGATDDLHGTMIAVKEAEISMKLVGTIRNKLLDAFQELWRTNV